MVEQYLAWQLSGQITCNTPLWPFLGLTDRWLDKPNPNKLVVSGPSTCLFYPTILFNLYLQQIPNPYLLGARKWLLWVNCIERIGIWPLLKTWNWQQLENILPVWIYWLCIPISTKMNGFHLGTFSAQVGLHGGWWSTGPAKNNYHLRCLLTKNKTKFLWIRLGEWSDRLPQICCHWLFGEGLLAKFSPFLRKSYRNKVYPSTRL